MKHKILIATKVLNSRMNIVQIHPLLTKSDRQD